MDRPVSHISRQRFGDLQVGLDLEIIEASVDGTLVLLPGDCGHTGRLTQELEVLERDDAVQVCFDLAVVGLDRFPGTW